MRVGLNALFLARPLTGSGRYVRHLVEELARLGRGHEYLLFGPAGAQPAELAWRSVRTPFDSWSEILAKVWFEQVGFPRACRRAGVDVAHYPYFAAPLAGLRPVIVTAHDLIPMLFPQYRGSARVRLYTALVAASARRASLVITDSAASRDDVVRRLGVPEERVRVIYLAADERFRPAADPAAVDAARRRYGLPDEYLLYLGGLDYRKNVPRLLQAYALAHREGLALPLVVAGSLPRPSALFPDLRGEVERLGLSSSVVFCGPGADEDTPLLFQAATAFVYPSLYEGFGLPPLEAMACGTPVVCANSSSLPEVVGDAALTVDPTDVTGLAAALRTIARDAGLREDLRGRGLARAAQFSWRRTAEETLAAYEEASQRFARSPITSN